MKKMKAGQKMKRKMININKEGDNEGRPENEEENYEQMKKKMKAGQKMKRTRINK